MMSGRDRVVSNDNINSITSLTECNGVDAGWWLYDKSRGMNLAMRAPSRELALIEALEYYQDRLIDVERRNKILLEKVKAFINSMAYFDIDFMLDEE